MKKLLILLVLTVSYPCFAASDNWGENVAGVITGLNVPSNKKIVALTFDVCGGKNGSALDKDLVKYLSDNKIRATIFVTGKFVKRNQQEFLELVKNPNFDIQNHGMWHRPASITGLAVYGVHGFTSVQGLTNEIVDADNYIYKLTKKHTTLYRSGGSYYEDSAIPIIKKLGYKTVGFSINGDLGATASADKIYQNISNAKSGDIVIDHMNHPESDVRAGVIKSIQSLKKQNFKFVFVKDYI
ncbi:MAG TPA: polysaccharide deacetylase family protein [Alphaproteobacteria bacterium]|nr:polysaccharide deacetylase family protein [Alphaproteobacteria bacterium]